MIPLSAIKFGLKYWRHIISVIAGLAVGFGAAWWIQGVRLNYAKSEISNLKSQIERCQDVNKTNQETIKNLGDEVLEINKSCIRRMKAKENLIRRLKHIDSLKNKELIKEESDDKSVRVAVDNPILRELNRMFDKAGKD